MKHSTMRWMIAAAALVAAAGSAAAQNYEAEIPMSFRVGKALMQPGVYQIHVATGTSTRVFVSNRNTHKAAVVVAFGNSDAPKGWRRGGNPNLKFECVRDECSLQQLWDGQNPTVLNLPAPQPPTLEARQKNSVNVAMSKSR